MDAYFRNLSYIIPPVKIIVLNNYNVYKYKLQAAVRPGCNMAGGSAAFFYIHLKILSMHSKISSGQTQYKRLKEQNAYGLFDYSVVLKLI